MNKTKNKSILITLLVISIIATEIYFFYSFLTKGLLIHYGYSIGYLTPIYQPIILALLMLLTGSPIFS